MDYEALLADSFRVSLRRPHLWFFGFFAGGSALSLNFFQGGGSSNDSSGLSGAEEIALATLAVQDPADGFDLGAATFPVVLIILLVIVSLVLVALSVLCRGALVDSVAVLDEGGQRGFLSTWRAGVRNFSGVLLFYVVYLLILLAAVVVVLLPLGSLAWILWVSLDSVALRLVLVFFDALVAGLSLAALSAILYVTAQFGLRALVIEGTSVTSALGRGLAILRQSPGRSLLVALIQIAILLSVALLLLPVIVVVSLLPLFAFQSAMSGNFSPEGINAALATIGVLFGVPFLVFSAVLGTFNSAYWTIAYLRMR